MRRFGKRLAAAALAAFMAVSTMTTAFAANSPTSGNSSSASNAVVPQAVTVNTTGGSAVSALVDLDNVVTIYSIDASGNGKKATIDSEFIGSDGKTYLVNVIASGSIKSKSKKVVLRLKKHTFVKGNCLSADIASYVGTIVIKKQGDGSLLTADQFDRDAFDNFTGTIKIKSSAMSQDEFNKLKASWTDFKGTLIYK